MNRNRAKLKQLRINNELFQKDIANLLDISTSFYSSIERGKRNPTLSLAKKTADLFGESIENIFYNNTKLEE
ncbi:MAG TPA: helix-turn-helix domain-containing protein [Halanaerobiales bacterium]|nr:helix-turn-helix domain-containing protein [Halanaerobiales bacterium]